MEYVFEKVIWDQSLTPTVSKLHETFVNELTEKQREKINQLRASTKDVLKPHHDDFFLHKWLKARKYDLAAGENMLRASLKWREEMGLDRIGEEYKATEVCSKYLPIGSLGEDKGGSPIWILPLGNLDVRGIVYSAKLTDICKYYIVMLETAERLNQTQTQKLGKLIANQTVIADMENFKLQDFIWKPAFDVFIAVLKALESNYPETLKKVFMINAPRVFSIFWAMIKPFLSEDTRNKIFIYGKDSWQGDVLEAIDPSQLPKHWGGTMVGDIDGNPYCSPNIVIGGPIPQSYYLTQSKRHSTNDKLLSVTVDKASVFKVEVTVEKPGSSISYTFETEENDIGFGITHKPQNIKKGNKTQIIPVTRVNCHYVPEEGSLLCDKSGIYTLVFDNRYSWYKSKNLLYEAHVTPPEDS